MQSWDPHQLDQADLVNKGLTLLSNTGNGGKTLLLHDEADQVLATCGSNLNELEKWFVLTCLAVEKGLEEIYQS
jgi:hypothetical protein